MATTEEIAWNDGSGDKIYVTSDAFEGDQTVLVSSDANAGAARTKTVTFSASGVTPVVITVSQEASITTIPYIRGGDGSYIDTGITPDQTTKIIIWARNWNINTANTCLFGSDSGNTTTNAFLVFTRMGATTGGISTSWGSNSVVNANDQWKHLSHYHKYEYGADGFYVDDVLVSSVTATTFSNPYSIYLFCDNRNGGQSITATQKDICACKIYKGGVLVRDYTAVNSPSVGLYDAVSDTVFTNAGSGTFTYGTFQHGAYTPLEYVSCNGNQYFNAGLKGSNNLNYVTKFSLSGTKQYPWLFGAQTSSSSKRYGVSFGVNNSVINKRIYFVYNTTLRTYDYGSSMNGKKLIAVKNGATAYLYENNTQKTSQSVSGTYSTDYNIYVATVNTAGSVSSGGHLMGDIYFLGFGSSRNYVPAKVNGVAGLYDTYNDVFKPSESGTAFIAGPEV